MDKEWARVCDKRREHHGELLRCQIQQGPPTQEIWYQPAPRNFDTRVVVIGEKGRGVRLVDILDWSLRCQWLEEAKLVIYLNAEFLLYIKWPGYEEETRQVRILAHDFCLATVAREVAKAYKTFFDDAVCFKYTGSNPHFQIKEKEGLFDIYSLYLVGLQWIGGDVFQAEIHYVVPDMVIVMQDSPYLALYEQ